MAQLAKFLSSTAGVASGSGGGLDVDDVFSCHLYEGTGSAQTITNGIDLSGEGGLVWIKNRDDAENHGLVDTAVNGLLFSNLTNAANTNVTHTFNSNGFTVGSAGSMNDSNDSHVSWTFRKAPKFFDVVTYSGNGSNRAISHNLGSVPGMIIVKGYDRSDGWAVYHRGHNGGTDPENYATFLSGANAQFSDSVYWNNTAPTSTQFTVGTEDIVNNASNNYIAYIFAHHNNDGEFGPDGDQDIIKCGSYTGNGSTTGPVVNVGFEPQWLMIKRASGSEDWMLFDAMRTVPTGGVGNDLRANSSAAEDNGINFIDFNSTGFQPQYAGAHVNTNGDTYIYMAIRRGPLAVPDDATKVFAIDEGDSSGAPEYTSGFPVDMAIKRYSADTDNWRISARLIQGINHYTNTTDADDADDKFKFDYQNGYYNDSQGANNFAWMWKRAPGYFDVVAYSGTGSTKTVSHNLGVAPEMIWVKSRDSSSENWVVFHEGAGTLNNTFFPLLFLNSTAAVTLDEDFTSQGMPTATSFTLNGTDRVNTYQGHNYIAYLFATVAGVSKVGSYTANGNAQNIDCGFSSGARFVLIKRYDLGGHWFVFDTVRGIVSGNDPNLQLNENNAQESTYDHIDPYSAGFTVAAYDDDDSPYVNQSGGSYLFYAIA